MIFVTLLKVVGVEGEGGRGGRGMIVEEHKSLYIGHFRSIYNYKIIVVVKSLYMRSIPITKALL